MGGVARSISMKPLVLKINRLNGSRWKVIKVRNLTSVAVWTYKQEYK